MKKKFLSFIKFKFFRNSPAHPDASIWDGQACPFCDGDIFSCDSKEKSETKSFPYPNMSNEGGEHI